MYKRLDNFKFWCQKILPLVYDDSLSYYEVLCKVVEYINNMITNEKEFASDIEQLNTNVSELRETVEEISIELEKIKNGQYESLYLNSLKNYIDTHLEAIVGRVVKFVSFGLSADGYFTALIPSTWDFVKFDTIVDPNSELYGHLVLNW